MEQAGLARFVVGRRSAYVVLLFWAGLLVGFGLLAGKLPAQERNDPSAYLPPSAESTQVIDLQRAVQPDDTLNAVVVYERDGGLTAGDRAQIRGDLARFATFDSIADPSPRPVFSRDGEAASVVLVFGVGHDPFSSASDIARDARQVLADDGDGLSAHLAGPLGGAADLLNSLEGVEGTLLYAAIAVVVIILLLTYRSPTLWVFPVVSAGVALLVAQGILYLLAAHADVTVNSQAAGILTVLVFGAGTDYALLLVARYREELHRFEDRHDAMAVALHRAGPAIVASAGTVAVGLLCLLFATSNATKGLGPAAAVAVATAMLAMITLLPAMLVSFGTWVFWPARPSYGAPQNLDGAWARIGRSIARRPRWVWVATVAILGTLGYAAVGLDATGLTHEETYRGTPDSVHGEQILGEHFPAGSGSPVIVVARPGAADAVHELLVDTKGIVGVPPARTAEGKAFFYGVLEPAADTTAAYDVVKHVRTEAHAIPGGDAKVGGDTAISLDVQNAASHDRLVIFPIVLGIVFLILVLLLRAVLGPILLIATVVLAYLSALGLSALAFDHVFGFGGADTVLPLFAFVFLVALGTDYNIFLMTRVREEAERHGTRSGALIGLAATGGVITSAGFVLAGTFAVLATVPVIAWAEIGFAVAIGVLLDTMIVRPVLVTALTLDVGRHFWWPSRLGKRPDVPLDELEVESAVGVD